MATPEPTQITVDDLTFEVAIRHTEYGPKVVLSGVNCAMEGDMPGEYLLVPVE